MAESLNLLLHVLFFILKILFIYSRETERERERQRPRQREKQAPCRGPYVGLDPWSPASSPGLQAALNCCATGAAQDFIYLFMREREREAETQAEGEAGSMQEARHGTRSRDSSITHWAEGRCQTAEPPGDPQNIRIFYK